jgi:hypothetical protein
VRIAFLAPPILALLVVLVSVQTPAGLSRTPQSPPTFNGDRAAGLARDLARELPDRAPGAPTAKIAADDVQAALQEATGSPVERVAFEAPGPDGSPVEMENLWVELPGQGKEAIIVLAHRDDVAPGPGLDDNASGTAALIELARGAAGIQRARALIVASVDGGTVGQAGSRALIDQVRAAGLTPVAAIAIDAIGGPPGVLPIRFAGTGGVRSPDRLLRGLEVAVDDVPQAGPAAPASPVTQILDLIAPAAPSGAQAPFLERGIAAIQLGDGDGGVGVAAIDQGRLDAVGAAISTLLVRLDAEPRTAIPAGTYIAISGRVIPGSAVALFALAFLVGPLLAVLVALAARRPRRSEWGEATLVVAIGALPGIALVLAAWGVDLAGGIDVPPGAPWPEAGVVGTVVAIGFALVVLAGAVVLAFRRGAPAVTPVAVPTFGLLAAALLAVGSPASTLLAVPALWVWTLIPAPNDLVRRFLWAVVPVVVPALFAFIVRGADVAVLVGAAGTGALPAPLVVGASALLGVGALALLAGDRPLHLPVRPTAGGR